jgi:hypothetical protein
MYEKENELNTKDAKDAKECNKKKLDGQLGPTRWTRRPNFEP